MAVTPERGQRAPVANLVVYPACAVYRKTPAKVYSCVCHSTPPGWARLLIFRGFSGSWHGQTTPTARRSAPLAFLVSLPWLPGLSKMCPKAYLFADWTGAHTVGAVTFLYSKSMG